MSAISKNETKWVFGYDTDHQLKYTITSNADRSWYYIYDKDNKKLGKAKTPPELYKKYLEE